MACFSVPVAEAIVVTAAAIIMKKAETSKQVRLTSGSSQNVETEQKPGFSRKLGWLAKLLWGGSFLLAFEHVWHGEVVPWFPFLTAMSDPEDTAEMLHEIATVGVAMAVLVTAVWIGMLVVSAALEKRAGKARLQAATQNG